MDNSDDLQWAEDNHRAPSGEQMERLLTITVRQNAFSRDGLALWKQHTLRRKRLRSDEGEALAVSDRDGIDAAANVVEASIHQLTQSSDFEYAPSLTAPPVQSSDLPATPSPLAFLKQPSTDAPVTAPVAAPTPDASPSPTATRADHMAPPAHAPMSALAKLVARAKAQQPASAAAASPSTPHHGDKTTTKATTASSSSRVTSGVEQAASTAATAATDDKEEDEDFGVVVPGMSAQDADGVARPGADGATAALKHPSQMTREEYLSQFKRAPRRGEIGQSADTILEAEKLGYVMSGSRSKAAKMYVDRIQRQLHEREAAKLQQQFRKVEDERQDDHLINGLLSLLEAKRRKHDQ